MSRRGRRQPGLPGWAVNVLLCLSTAKAVAARQAPEPSRAATTITGEELARHLGALAADSMCGRAIPSPELEHAARYVAAQFQELGLTPLRPGAEWLQRYPIPGQLVLDWAKTAVYVTVNPSTVGGRIAVTEAGSLVRKIAVLNLASSELRFVREVGVPTLPQPTFSLIDLFANRHATVLAGYHTAATLPLTALHDQVVIYVPSAMADSATRQHMLEQLYANSAGVIVVSDQDSVHFAASAARDREQPVRIVDRFVRGPASRRWPWAVAIRSARFEASLRTVGLDLKNLQATSVPVRRALPGLGIRLQVIVDEGAALQTGMNVIGALEGADSALNRSYIAFTAHLGIQGPCPGQPNRTRSVMAPDASIGIAGLLALAKAFSQPDARPRRSVLFLVTTEGTGEPPSWGSNAYLDQARPRTLEATLSLDRLGMAGRVSTGGDDTLLIDGLQDVDLGFSPIWTAAAHPELGVAVAGGGTAIDTNASHYPFVRYGIPSLAWHFWRHVERQAQTGEDDVAQATDRLARALRLVFYVGEELADADQPSRWTAEGRQRFAAVQEP